LGGVVFSSVETVLFSAAGRVVVACGAVLVAQPVSEKQRNAAAIKRYLFIV
jgi:hypothetical protein